MKRYIYKILLTLMLCSGLTIKFTPNLHIGFAFEIFAMDSDDDWDDSWFEDLVDYYNDDKNGDGVSDDSPVDVDRIAKQGNYTPTAYIEMDDCKIPYAYVDQRGHIIVYNYDTTRSGWPSFYNDNAWSSDDYSISEAQHHDYDNDDFDPCDYGDCDDDNGNNGGDDNNNNGGDNDNDKDEECQGDPCPICGKFLTIWQGSDCDRCTGHDECEGEKCGTCGGYKIGENAIQLRSETAPSCKACTCLPCNEEQAQKITDLFNDPALKKALDIYIREKGRNVEMANPIIKNNTTGSYSPGSTTYSTLGKSVNFTNYTSSPGYTTEGYIHWHTPGEVLPSLSAGDLYALAEMNTANKDFKYLYAVTETEAYAFVINDPGKLSGFCNAYPKQNNMDTSTGMFAGELLTDFEKATVGFTYPKRNLATAQGMAFMLSCYDIGVAIYEKDANGDFKELKMNYRKPDDGGNKRFIIDNCK